MENLKNKFETLKLYDESVSRETFDKLCQYESLLREWQQKFNLVATSTLDNAWVRHVCDSVQLLKFVPSFAKSLCDIGSGAGFPGMVLAVFLNVKTPYLNIVLVESVRKKTLYLNAVKGALGVKVNIINDRIENVNQKFDVITSRAVANLSKLFELSSKVSKSSSVLIFPKGENFAAEIKEAKKNWLFKYKAEPSMTNENSKILIITGLRRKK